MSRILSDVILKNCIENKNEIRNDISTPAIHLG
jgi:hypothetical protein